MASGDSENRINLFRLQILIIDGGLLVLRSILDQTIAAKGLTLRACLNNERLTITRLLGRNVIIQDQYDLLFPMGGQDPTTADMDITLIICLLTNLQCFGLNKKFKWNAIPASTDKSIEADICRLRKFRNDICHMPTTTGIDQNDFARLWYEIEQILIRLNTPGLNIHQTIADFKSCPLDLEEHKRIEEEIKKCKDYQAVIDRLELEMGDVKENVTEIQKNLDDVNKNATEVRRDFRDVKENVTEVQIGLDDVKGKVMEVQKDLEEVKIRQQTDDFPIQTEEEKYQTRKEELRDGLIEFYKTRHSKVFLSPFFKQNDTPLASFYIRPELNLIISAPAGNDEKSPIKSLSEMFKTEEQANREIHVIADAGLGKTTFSNYLAITWCQAHFPDEDLTQSFEKDDTDCMQEFDFLFLVLLRDSNDLCSIDDLIFENIISNLGLEEKPSVNVLLKILKNEKCLVILDGLDEWTHPEKECHRSPRSIPHRNDRKTCTILTTTRPWKLGVLNLDSCQIGKKVELTKLSYNSAVTLTERILQRLKSHPDKIALQRDVTAFISGIKSRQNDDITSVPLLLIYAICSWCNRVQIQNSKCELYINIVELLLSRTIQKHGDLQQFCDLSDSDIPKCLAEYKNCTKYYPLLMCLAKLAYYTLFNETRENTLVFDGSVAEEYLTPEEMKFTLHSGMLSESTHKKLIHKLSKVSFSHKTVQEFFAAIFISSESGAQKIVLEKCKNIQDILDVSKICEFISKINVDRMCELSEVLMSVINEDEETRDYRTRTGEENLYDNPLYNIQVMFMSCLQEMPENENIQLCLQDFFINENTVDSEQFQYLLKQNKTNVKSLYINTRYTSRSLRKIIDLFNPEDLSHIQKLYYEGRREKEVEINRIFVPSLQAVTLRRGTWTDDEENLSENLARVQNVQNLYIEWLTLSHKILETFFNFISGHKSRKELTLKYLNCKEHGYHECRSSNLDLSQHSTLSKLYVRELPWRLQLNISTPSLVNLTLEYINLDESSLLLLQSRDMLNIERVELLLITISAGSLQNFITVLENLPQSVTVQMAVIKPKTEYDRVREIIRRSQTFHVIQDEYFFEFKTRKPSKK